MFDGLSAVLGGVIRGAGKQLLAAPCVLVSYYILGLPTAAYFGFVAKLGVTGLCLGTLLGTVCHAGCFYILIWQYAHDLCLVTIVIMRCSILHIEPDLMT